MVDNCELSLFNIYNELIDDNSLKDVSIKALLVDCTREYFIEYFKDKSIDFIYHVAAYKHVNLSEENPLSYYHNNIISTDYCQKLSVMKGSKFVLVSTDKAVNPLM